MFGEMLFADTLYADNNFLDISGWFVRCSKDINWNDESIDQTYLLKQVIEQVSGLIKKLKKNK